MTIYDILKDIITFKTGTLSEKSDFGKVFNRFIIMRYLSMHPSSVSVVEELNMYIKYTKLSDGQFYKLLVQRIPKTHNNYIKYITKPKDKNSGGN